MSEISIQKNGKVLEIKLNRLAVKNVNEIRATKSDFSKENDKQDIYTILHLAANAAPLNIFTLGTKYIDYFASCYS